MPTLFDSISMGVIGLAKKKKALGKRLGNPILQKGFLRISAANQRVIQYYTMVNDKTVS